MTDLRPLAVPGQLEPWGVVAIPPGDRWRVLAEARGLVNLGLLSAEEQDQAEDAWQAALRALDFPLQICVHSRPVQLPDLAAAGGRQGLTAYAMAYRQHLALWSRHTVQVRRVFFVIPAEGEEAEAARILERRVRTLAGGLERWVSLRVLDLDGVLQVLAAFWRKGRAPAEPPGRWDWNRLFVEGVRIRDVRRAVLEEVAGQEPPRA